MAFGLSSYVPLLVGAVVGVYLVYQLVIKSPITPSDVKKKRRRKKTTSSSSLSKAGSLPKDPQAEAYVASNGSAYEGMSAQDMQFYNALLSMNQPDDANPAFSEMLPEQGEENAEMTLESMNAAMKFALFQMLKDKSFPMEDTNNEEAAARNYHDDDGEMMMGEEEAQQYLAFLHQYLSANEEQSTSMTDSSSRQRTAAKKSSSKGAKRTKRRQAERHEAEEEVSEWSDISE